VLGDVSEGLELSATNSGLLAVSEHTFGARAAWFDRSGHELSTFTLPGVFVGSISISPDNKQALGTSYSGGSLTLWRVDLERNVSTRLVTNGGFPVWAPDGTRFAYISVGTGGPADLSVRSTVRSEEAVWLKTDDIKVVTDWSLDGRWLLFHSNADNSQGLWVMPTDGDRKPKLLLQTSGSRTGNGRFSPDGRLVAFVSDETGKSELYLAPLAMPTMKQQVSTGGGAPAVWRRDGREVFYLGNGRSVMAVAMSSGDRSVPGKPELLFTAPNAAGPFAVTNDGQRFLLVLRNHPADRGAITMLLNWAAAR
jgi:eukaryotic-like serine/threonine-protein kinase